MFEPFNTFSDAHSWITTPVVASQDQQRVSSKTEISLRSLTDSAKQGSFVMSAARFAPRSTRPNAKNLHKRALIDHPRSTV
nr:hypothetical protein CFP56_22325 [Quercus suber]